MTARKKPVLAPPLETLIENARHLVEHDALVAISGRLRTLFEDPAFVAELTKASGKKKLSERALNDLAGDIKERALEDIARIFKEGLY